MAEKGLVKAIVKRVASGMPGGVSVGDEITMSEAEFDKHAAAGNVDSADTLTRAQQRGANPIAGSADAARAEELDNKQPRNR